MTGITSFVERLKKWMIDNNLNQSDLCKKTNMTSGFISGICTGKRPPSPNFLNILQEISNKSQEWWLTGDDLPNLDDVNDLINTYIKLGLIDIDGNMEDSTKETIYNLLNNKIHEKLKILKNNDKFK